MTILDLDITFLMLNLKSFYFLPCIGHMSQDKPSSRYFMGPYGQVTCAVLRLKVKSHCENQAHTLYNRSSFLLPFSFYREDYNSK